MNFDNGSAPAGPGTVGYRLEGEGARSVVLLHGLNAHSGTWRKTIPELSRFCRVLAPSLPPHSGRVTESLAESYAYLVRALMLRLRFSGSVIAGNSMGGWTAMKVARSGDGLVRKVLLEDTAGARSGDAERLSGASLPVSIVWGENDSTIPLSEGRFLHSRLPGSELHVVKDAGHVPHWERPSEFNAILIGFVGR